MRLRFALRDSRLNDNVLEEAQGIYRCLPPTHLSDACPSQHSPRISAKSIHPGSRAGTIGVLHSAKICEQMFVKKLIRTTYVVSGSSHILLEVDCSAIIITTLIIISIQY